MKTRKSWREKLADNKDLPRMLEVKGKLRARWGQGPMLIPAPSEVDALMKRVLIADLEKTLFTGLADTP